MRRPTVRDVSIVALPTAIALVTVLLVPRRAESEPAPRFPVEQPVPVAARVALLEQRVHGLEQRLKAFEKLSVKAQTDGGYVLVANGARVQIGRDGSVTVTSPPGASGTTARASMPMQDPCDPPYAVGENGVRTIKPECLQVAPCDPPYTVDAQGRRQAKKECM